MTHSHCLGHKAQRWELNQEFERSPRQAAPLHSCKYRRLRAPATTAIQLFLSSLQQLRNHLQSALTRYPQPTLSAGSTELALQRV
jgi:hypothetical protein